jgi:Holliday junction resolvase RusA-like endonuclease
MSYKFFIDLPPTINHYHGQSKFGGKYIKPHGKLFRKRIAYILNKLNLPVIDEPTKITLHLFLNNYTKKGVIKKNKTDVDNRKKVLLDALKQDEKEPNHPYIITDDSTVFISVDIKYHLKDIPFQCAMVELEKIKEPTCSIDFQDLPSYLHEAMRIL